MKKTQIIIFPVIVMLAILFTIVFLSCASQITKTQPSQNLTNIPSSRPTTSHDTPTTTAPVQPSKSSQTLEEIELKYDNGEGNILPKNLAMPIVIGECGYLIDFSPLSKPFNIRKIKIYGTVQLCPSWPRPSNSLEDYSFVVEIYDSDLKLLNKAIYPLNKFTENNLTWIELSFPNLELNDKFYIHICPDLRKKFFWTILVGVDDNIPNYHSFLSNLQSKDVAIKISPWHDWAIDGSNINWMIRVVGTY